MPGMDMGSGSEMDHSGMDMGGDSDPGSGGLGMAVGDVEYRSYLVNGRPPSDPFTVAARRGERLRLRLVNRSEERRAGNECVSTCSYLLSPHHHKNNDSNPRYCI